MINVSPWDEMLQTYVNLQGRVDYRRWQAESASWLEDWLASLSSFDPAALDRQEGLALLLNLYNALTVQQVLKRYPIASIQPTWLGIPNWIAFWRFFTRSIYTLNGQQLSLNQIEHGLLRQQYSEPRIHFALVCASTGCPLLRNRAYRADQVEQQLEEDAQRFIQNPQKVRYEAAEQTLYCSKIFKWYRQDFLRVAPSVPDYIQLYLPAAGLSGATTVKYLPYDWSLNQIASSS
ncbi:MAG: DUF547 domain-containing protein [Cyanobacteria bacterium Co-bin8]|nr:DUF547 domain-containing protein [Cyanobacteria bacterium Co-bin8]